MVVIMMNWYAMQAKPQKEEFLYQQLCLRTIETYFPRIRAKAVNPRARKVKPFFPGYMFLRTDFSTSSIALLQWIPGAIGIVSFGGEPASVTDDFIHLLQKQLGEINQGKQDIDGLKPGAPVVICDGPFRGYEAIFDSRCSGTDRIRILLTMLCNRQVPLEISDGYIQCKNQY